LRVLADFPNRVDDDEARSLGQPIEIADLPDAANARPRKPSLCKDYLRRRLRGGDSGRNALNNVVPIGLRLLARARSPRMLAAGTPPTQAAWAHSGWPQLHPSSVPAALAFASSAQ
jgi:hypothetical protein